MTAWYREGTVTATNGSTTVTGALTAWLANVKVGDVWCPDADGRGYEITAVGSNTSITIYPAYAGATGSGKAYGIARFSTNWNSVSDIGVSLAEILAAQTSILAGNGVPSDSLGQDDDVYFRQDVAEYYTKGSGTWTLVTALIGPQGPAGPSYQATSTSSVAIGTGAKTFTVQSGRGYSAGQWVRVSNSSSNYMEGTVTSYSGTTLIINVPAGRAIGSGTYTSWNVNITGDVGPANSLAIGSITTGAAGSSASATITGTAPSQTLNLTIPRGNTGATGETGPQGAPGAAATITVGTVDTVNPDDPATVTNSGTSGAAVFDFEIPKGAPGTPINHRGDYNGATTYALNDAVRVLGSTWVYINATPGSGNAPPTLPTESNSYWQLMAQAGSNGTGAVDLVNGQSGVVVLDGTDIDAAHTAVNYTPAGDGIADHLAGIDAALDNVSSYGDAPTATVPSAGTTDIGAAAGFNIEITGTTTITSLGTVPNVWRIVRFAGVLTLTHHATSLILPGGANIVTAAGDTAIFLSDGSGNWRCSQYQRSNGRSVNLGTASQAALLDEDDMASDSATAVPSQQSVKAYVDANAGQSWQFYAALSLEMSEATGAAIAAGDDGNGLFDGFGALTYVDTAGATNLDTSTAGVLKPTVTTATAMTNLVLAENSNNWAGYNLIQLLPAASLIAGGTQARFRMRGPGTGSTAITGMTVAKKASSGDAYDAGETPVAITVSGSGAFTIPTNGDVWSDWIDYTLDDTVDLLIKMHFGASTTLRRRSGATGHQAYEKSASSEVTTANVTGYSAGTAGYSYVVEEIQVRVGVADLSVSSAAMTLTATPASAEVIMFASVNDATINTDLIVAVSRDGIDFQDFAMTYKYNRPDGSGVYVSGPVEITADAGTTGKWQCRTDNNKMPSVKAIGVQFFA